MHEHPQSRYYIGFNMINYFLDISVLGNVQVGPCALLQKKGEQFVTFFNNIRLVHQ